MVSTIWREWWWEKKRKASSKHNWTFLCFLFLCGLEGRVRQDLGHMVIIPSEIPLLSPAYFFLNLSRPLSLSGIVFLCFSVSEVTKNKLGFCVTTTKDFKWRGRYVLTVSERTKVVLEPSDFQECLTLGLSEAASRLVWCEKNWLSNINFECLTGGKLWKWHGYVVVL